MKAAYSVGLIERRADRATGFGRYATSLAQALSQLGVVVQRGSLVNPLPKSMTRLLARAGQDAETFFGNYGLKASLPRADVYHLTTEYQAPLLLLSRARPSVVTVHGFLTFLLRHQADIRMDGTLGEALFDRLVIRGLRAADAIIAVSEFLKRQLIQQVGLPPASIRVIPEGVDTEFFSPRPAGTEVRARYGLPPDRRWILYVGSEQPRKNFVGLIRAFAELRRTRPDLALLKVGQPEVIEERGRAFAVARALGVRDAIYFVGHASEHLPDLYNLADLFVFPSLYEGFGLPPLEAMACGTPVVCSNRTSLPEVVGDAALTCEPDFLALAEAMARVLDNPELSRELAFRGRTHAQKQSWARAAMATNEVYLAARERRSKTRRASEVH